MHKPPSFKSYFNKLQSIHAKLPLQLMDAKKQQWLDKMLAADIVLEDAATIQRLFLAHSFLVTFVRCVIHTLTKHDKPKTNDILSEGFVSWIAETKKGQRWANRLVLKIHDYDWRQYPIDVFRHIYEMSIGEQDRREFGEFYTPDWLAELLVREICDDKWCNTSIRKVLKARRKGRRIEGVGVLDPTCGSGTFLYHAAKRLLACSEASNLSDIDKADVVCALVRGIDINPVAVEMARATLLRALPVEPSPRTTIHVYEGDALMIRRHVFSLFPTEDQIPSNILTVAERKVDRIIANPPWIAISKMQIESKKRALEQFAKHSDIDLWVGGKQAPHFDIAQLFIKRARQLYLATPNINPAVWLIKKAALRSGNWAKFQRWHKPICRQIIDLETVDPFSGGDARRCVVLFEHRASSIKRKEHYIVAQTKGKIPSNINFTDAMKQISFRTTTSNVSQKSDYINRQGKSTFRQGATITPQSSDGC